VRVNTEQATVEGVVTAHQIESLPIDGCNFLNLAQLEPGVQIQEGSTFDPTKNGFSSISSGGRFGRTARIEVDGLDISDETVGTTTQNIPASAIQEFQLAQSTLDLSTELTSSGGDRGEPAGAHSADSMINGRHVGTRTPDLYCVNLDFKPLQPFGSVAFPFLETRKTALKQPIFVDELLTSSRNVSSGKMRRIGSE
jgi:hypothetical protein